jgi:hypothetical protein
MKNVRRRVLFQEGISNTKRQSNVMVLFVLASVDVSTRRQSWNNTNLPTVKTSNVTRSSLQSTK